MFISVTFVPACVGAIRLSVKILQRTYVPAARLIEYNFSVDRPNFLTACNRRCA